jgi:hypothetical protein
MGEGEETKAFGKRDCLHPVKMDFASRFFPVLSINVNLETITRYPGTQIDQVSFCPSPSL